MDTVVGSLMQSFNPDQVYTDDGISTCSKVLVELGSMTRNGFIVGTQPATLTYLVSTLSAFVRVPSAEMNCTLVGGAVLPQFAVECAVQVAVAQGLRDISVGVANNMAVGENPTSLISGNVRSAVHKNLVSSMGNASLSPPATAEEAAYGVVQPTVSLPGSGLSKCQSASGTLPMGITQFGSNPYHSAQPTDSTVMQFSSTQTTSSVTNHARSIVMPDVHPGQSPEYFITLQFAAEQNFNFTLAASGKRLKNFTMPACTFHNGDGFVPCHGCNISSYTNYNVTYGCYDLSMLCDTGTPSTHGRRLQSSASSAIESVASYAVLLEALAAQLKKTMSFNPLTLDLKKAAAILSFVGSLVFALCGGAVFFMHWDTKDHNDAIYLLKEKRRNHRPADLVKRHVSFKGLTSAFLMKSDAAEVVASPNTKIVEEKDGKIEGVEEVVESVDVNQILENFLGTAFPAKTLLTDTPSLLTRFWKANILFNPYFCMVALPNLEYTRTMRWLSLSMGILTCLFMDTLFYGVFFPDTSVCPMFSATSMEMCLSTQSQVQSGTPMCAWDVDTLNCTLNPPPESVTFLMVIALICVLVVLPMDMIMEMFMFEAGKRPDLTPLGLVTDGWMGSDGTALKTAEDSLPAEQNDMQKVMEAHVVELRNALEANHVAHSLYEDIHSPEEEVSLLLHKVKMFFCNDADAPAIGPSAVSIIKHRDAKVKAIVKILGVYPNGQPVPLTLRERLTRYSSPRNKMLSKITKARVKAAEILDAVSGYEDCEGDYKDCTLIQYFVLEQMTFFKRYTLNQQFFNFPRLAPELVDWRTWVCAWICTVSGFLYFLYYMFAWGAVSGPTTLKNWGINFVIGIIQDLAFVQPFKVVITFLLCSESMRPQLRSIQRTLMSIALQYVDPKYERTDDFRVVQHTSGACRAARSKIAQHMPAAYILRQVDDVDTEACRKNRDFSVGTIALVIIAIPVLVAMVSSFLGDQFLEFALPSILCGITVVFQALLDISVGFFVIPLILMLAFAFYHYGLLTPALARVKKLISVAHTAERKWAMPKRATRGGATTWSRVVKYFDLLLTHFFVCVVALSHPMIEDPDVTATHATNVNQIWKHMNLSRIVQGAVLDETALETSDAFEEAAHRTVGDDDDSMVIPEEIQNLVMSDDVAWTRQESSFDIFVNRTVFNVHGTFDPSSCNKPRDLSMNTLGPRSKGIRAFLDRAMTSDPDIVLRDLLNNHFAQGVQDMFQMVQRASGDVAHHSIDDWRASLDTGSSHCPLSKDALAELFPLIWKRFYPHGTRVSVAEMQEISEDFEWFLSHGENSDDEGEEQGGGGASLGKESVTFPEFRVFFLKLLRRLMKSRENKNLGQSLPKRARRLRNRLAGEDSESKESVQDGGSDSGNGSESTFGSVFDEFDVMMLETV